VNLLLSILIIALLASQQRFGIRFRNTIERDHFGGAVNTYSGEPTILSLVNWYRSRTLGWHWAIRLHGALVTSFRVRFSRTGCAGMSVLGRAHIRLFIER